MTLGVASLALVLGLDALPAAFVGGVVFGAFAVLGWSIDRRAR